MNLVERLTHVISIEFIEVASIAQENRVRKDSGPDERRVGIDHPPKCHLAAFSLTGILSLGR